MNVVFHTTAAIGIAVLLTDTKKIESSVDFKDIILISMAAFIAGIISHGALDYIPHCYPINSKIDAIAGLIIILTTIWLANKKYRLIMVFSFLGCILPDLIDLLPNILNKQLGLNLPVIDKIFLWHFHDYSGSIYTSNCKYSTLNHILLLLNTFIVCWCRRKDLKIMFNKRNTACFES
jgi:hypothetical protein